MLIEFNLKRGAPRLIQCAPPTRESRAHRVHLAEPAPGPLCPPPRPVLGLAQVGGGPAAGVEVEGMGHMTSKPLC